MPFVSKKQQGYLHAHPEILGKTKLAEYDRKTNFKKLREYVSKGRKKGKNDTGSK